MNMNEIIKKEEQNHGTIYLYVDKVHCIAYEFSAYMLAQIFPSLELKREVVLEVGNVLFVIQLSFKSIIELFTDSVAVLGHGYIKIDLDALYSSRIIKWLNEFDILKNERDEDNSRLGTCRLGCLRLRK